MSFGLFALGALQGYAIAGGQTSGYRLQASLLAADVADMLRANPAALAVADEGAGSADEADGSEAQSDLQPCRFPDCTASALAARDLALLRSRIRSGLPQGRLRIAAVLPAGDADVWVGWQEPRFHARGEGAPGAAAEQDFDVCPAEWRSADAAPRCLYLRVRL